MITFTIPIDAKGKKEARRRRNGHVYKHRETRDLMQIIASYVLASYQGPLLDGPLKVDIKSYRKRPRSVSKSKIWAATKPDYDNIAKLLGDALEGILWTNDSRIVDGRVRKYFARQGEASRVELQISKASNEQFVDAI